MSWDFLWHLFSAGTKTRDPDLLVAFFCQAEPLNLLGWSCCGVDLAPKTHLGHFWLNRDENKSYTYLYFHDHVSEPQVNGCLVLLIRSYNVHRGFPLGGVLTLNTAMVGLSFE